MTLAQAEVGEGSRAIGARLRALPVGRYGVVHFVRSRRSCSAPSSRSQARADSLGDGRLNDAALAATSESHSSAESAGSEWPA